MKARMPDPSQVGAHSVVTGPTLQEQLAALIALVEVLVLNLCVIRTAADLLRGSMSAEGGITLAVAVSLAIALVRYQLRSRRRSARGHGDGGRRRRSAWG